MSEIKVEVVKDSRGFAALEREWGDLYQNCPRTTPFQSWQWLYSWWEYYGESYELRLITMRLSDGLLVGTVPLMLERRIGFGRLLWIGTGLSDYLDVVVRAGWERQVAEAAVRALVGIRSWYVLDLHQVRLDAAACDIYQSWCGPRLYVRQGGCPVIEVKPWDELLASLSKNLRSTVRRAARRAADDGLYRKIAETPDTKQAARRLVALHREAWQERSIGPEHLTKTFEDFIVAAADRMVDMELGGISEFWQGEEVCISNLLLLGRGYCGTYVQGASQKAMQRYQWSSLYIWDAVEIAHSKNMSYLDLLRGEEPYKLRWSSSVISTNRLIMGRHQASWMAYAGYHALRSRAKVYSRCEAAPYWIKRAAGEYRALKRKIIFEAQKFRGRI